MHSIVHIISNIWQATHNCHWKKNLDIYTSLPHQAKVKTAVTHTCCMNLDTMPVSVRFKFFFWGSTRGWGGWKSIPHPRKNFSARIFWENRKSCFSAGSGFFTYRPKFSALLNLRPNQIGAAKYQATPLPPNTKSYSYSIPHLSRSLHDFIGSHGDSGGHIKQTVCCGKKVIFICIVVSCLYY